MTRLVHLNGPPGIGKSTLALRYVADRPLALCLDIDQLRRNLGQWRVDPGASGLAAREVAYAVIRTHLAAGHDVVVPQLAVRADFVEQLAAIAGECGAAFHEVVLTDAPEAVLERFRARAAVPALADHHRDAVGQLGGEDGLLRWVAELETLVASRPGAVVVPTRAGAVEVAYAALLEALGSREATVDGATRG